VLEFRGWLYRGVGLVLIHINILLIISCGAAMAALRPPPCDIAFPDLRQQEEPGGSRTRVKKLHLLPAAARHAISRSKIWRYSRHLIETAAHTAHGKFKKKEQRADGANPDVNPISSSIINTGAHVARDAYPTPAAEGGEEQLQVLPPDEMQASPPHDLVATPPTTSLMQRRATTEGYPSPQQRTKSITK
jgi:hypothetical protein